MDGLDGWTCTIFRNEEAELIVEKRKERVAAICSPWFGYGEYLTVEIDTEAKTCVVIAKP